MAGTSEILILNVFSNESDSMISEHQFEAINSDEAEARAYLNCVIENHNNRNVRVSVKKRIVIFVINDKSKTLLIGRLNMQNLKINC